MTTVNVDVDVEMTDFNDQDLVEELESRGWFVGPEKRWEPLFQELTNEEIDDILSKYSWAIPGTLGFDIYEKLRKR